jgi:hypothetical protein
MTRAKCPRDDRFALLASGRRRRGTVETYQADGDPDSSVTPVTATLSSASQSRDKGVASAEPLLSVHGPADLARPADES